MRRQGITKQGVRERMIELDFQTPEMQTIIEPALAKIQNQGYVRPTYNMPKNRISRKGRLVQLAGQRSDISMDILVYTVSTEKSLQKIKFELLNAYLNTPIEDLPIKIRVEPL